MKVVEEAKGRKTGDRRRKRKKRSLCFNKLKVEFGTSGI